MLILIMNQNGRSPHSPIKKKKKKKDNKIIYIYFLNIERNKINIIVCVMKYH